MKSSTERLLQAGAVCAILYFGWNFLSNTVVYMINMQMKVNATQAQLDACKAQMAPQERHDR